MALIAPQQKRAASAALSAALVHHLFTGQLTGKTTANVASKMLAGGSA